MSTTHDENLLEFRIRGFRLDTLPMATLAEYMAELSRLLGHETNVHFVRLRRGSVGMVHRLEPDASAQIRDRIERTATHAGDPEANAAYERLDEKLRRDGVRAELRSATDRTSKLLIFPGAAHPNQQPIGPLKVEGVVTGTPVNVGGVQTLANVNLQDGDQVHFCEATRDVAIKIAPHLFSDVIHAHGEGRYIRQPEGRWVMTRFRIFGFRVLQPESVDETLDAARALSGQPTHEDVLQELADLRRSLVEA